MTRLIADLCDRFAGGEQMTPLEYGLAAIFVAMALVASIPGLARALIATLHQAYVPFA